MFTRVNTTGNQEPVKVHWVMLKERVLFGVMAAGLLNIPMAFE